MGAAEAKVFSAAFLAPCQVGSRGKKDQRASEAKTKRIAPRYLLTVDDIQAAVAWRLEGLPTDFVEAVACQIRPYAYDFRDDRPEVAAVLSELHVPGDRRSEWSLACAVMSRDSVIRGDQAHAMLFGFEVVAAMRQSVRGKHCNRVRHVNDALDGLIAEHLDSIPCASMFDHLTKFACAFHEVLIEYDADRDELVCALDPNSETLTNITRGDVSARIVRHKRNA